MKSKPSSPVARSLTVLGGVVLGGLLAALLALAPEAIAQQGTAQPSGAAPGPIYSKQPKGGLVTKPKEFYRTIKGPFDPGQLYVKFREGTTLEQKQAAHAAARMIRVEYSFRVLPQTMHVSVTPGREQEAINAYLDDPNVIYAEPAYLREPIATVPNDPDWWLLWGGDKINLPHAWDVFTGDPNFKIGVVDSGLNYTHDDLAANVWTNPGEIPGNGIDDDLNGKVDDIHGWSFGRSPQGNDITDVDELHGTHVSGIIGAVGNNSTKVVGMNWHCKIVMGSCGRPGTNSLRNTCDAFDYILDLGVRVSNHSYGSIVESATECDMFNAAVQLGHLAVCGAGNDAVDNDGPTPFYPASYPLDSIIAVAATDTFELLGDFSNYGATSVDLAAPGVNILSTSTLPDGTAYKQGTSMASPHVAGVIGLIWSKFPKLTAQQMRARILTGVTKIDGLSGKVATGGRLDAARSMAVVTQPGVLFGNGHPDDPFGNFNAALVNVPYYGQLYIKVPASPWSYTGRIAGSPKRIAPWSNPIRVGP